jgi:biotin carboxyl carrier protein
MKRYRITLEDHTFDVKVLDDPRREQVRVEVNGETFTVGVEAVPTAAAETVAESMPAFALSPAEPSRPPRSSDTSQVSEVPGSPGSTVAAPLPGVVKSIGVRPGQQVAADDELLVIEAMKMDNVIRASRAGTVGAIHVTKGHRVAYGEPLLEMTNDK